MKNVFTIFIILFLSFNSILNAQPAIRWQKNYGGSGDDNIGDVTNYYDAPDHSIANTSDGGFVIVGNSSSIDGDAVSNYGLNDILLIRCDALGNKIWSKSFGGSGNEEITSVLQTHDGGFALCGFSSSNDVDISNNHGGYDVIIFKLDSLGNIIWQNSYGGSLDERAYSFTETNDGSFVVGAFSESSNGDVPSNKGGWDFWFLRIDTLGSVFSSVTYGGSGNDWANSIKRTDINSGYEGYILCGWTNSSNFDIANNFGLTDIWIVKTDSLGLLEWSQTYGGSMNDWGTCIISTGNGYAVSGFSESSDGQITGAQGGLDAWILRIDSLGSLLWQKDIGGSQNDEAYEIFKTTDNGFIAAGATRSDNGAIVGNFGWFDYFLIKLDSAGNLGWTKTYGGSGVEWAVSTIPTSTGDFLVAGSTSSNDFNITTNYGGWDLWVMKLTTDYNSISGRIYKDNNNNSLYDSGDFPLAGKLVSDTVTNQYAYTDIDGAYSLQEIDTGTFVLETDSVLYHNLIPASYTVNFSGINLIDSAKDFVAVPVPGISDLRINITPLGRFRRGFSASYLISFSNVGTTTLSASILLVLDSALTYTSADLSPAFINGDSILWNGVTLIPGQQGTIIVNFDVSTNANNGDNVFSLVSIDAGVQDETIYDNLSSWLSTITGSFDPNDKAVNVENVFADQLNNPDYLDYVIRFQNVGNDTAFTVVVRDFISEYLDMNSFEIVAFSHPFSINYDPLLRLLKFTFSNILLPDTTTNDSASNGFVHYHIKPYTTLQITDHILNTASIYFDFNEAVVTNTVVTNIMLTDHISSADNYIDLIVYPNPASDIINLVFNRNQLKVYSIQLCNLLGERIFEASQIDSNELISFPIRNLSEGIYFLKINSTEGLYTKKIVKN